MELALENATDKSSTVEKLLSSTSFDNSALACLEDYLELYSNAAWRTVDSLGAFLFENHSRTRMRMRAIINAASTCHEGFEERSKVPPSLKENHNLFHVCDIVLTCLPFQYLSN